MVKNFTTDADLTPYYPGIEELKHLRGTSPETTLEVRRMQAFDLLLDDFRFRGIDARRLHNPVDLNWPTTSTGTHINPVSFTKTSTFTSEYVGGLQGFKRFVIGVTAITGSISYTVQFQGSNDSAWAEANWQNIGSAVTLTTVGNTTIVMQTEYLYYRYVLTIGAGGSITYTLGLYETYIDRLIVIKTFVLIFGNLRKELNDMWDLRYQQAVNDYEMVMETAKYHVDEDASTTPSEEEDTGSGAITLMR